MLFNKLAVADDLHFSYGIAQQKHAERGNEMFRAQLKQTADGSVLKMEGRLVGDWANEARLLVARGCTPEGLTVDLSEVTYVDGVGEQLLTWLSSMGAMFVAKAVYVAAICERLNLPVQNNRPIDETQYRGVLIAQEGSH